MNYSFEKAVRLCVMVFTVTVSVNLIACEDPASLYNEVEGLRILAIRSTPPAVAAGESAVVDALVVSPGDEEISLAWELCIYTLGSNDLRRCPGDSILASGSGENFSFETTQEMAERVIPFCQAHESLAETLPEGAVLPECTQDGILATIRLRASSSSGEELFAVKRILLSEAPQDPADTNPRIQLIENVPEAVSSEQSYTLTCVPDETSLDIIVPGEDDDDDEEPGHDDEEPGEPRPEELDYTWFVAGAKYTSPGEDNPNPEEVRFKVHKEATTVRAWIVIRDERSGVDWRELRFEVETQ